MTITRLRTGSSYQVSRLDCNEHVLTSSIGCWTCRRRGYRCDEQRPHCKTCLRLAIPCEGYGVRLKWEHGRSTGAPKDKTEKRRDEKRSKRQEATAENWSLTSPTCSGLLSAPSTTQPTPSNSKAEPLATQQDSLASPASPLPLLPGRPPLDIFLLQHYVFTVAGLLCSTPDRAVNTYTTTVLPLMLEHHCLLDTVLALSAVHLASRYPVSTVQFSVRGTYLKGAGMRGLINRLNVSGHHQDGGYDYSINCTKHRPRYLDEGTLATIIMLSILEVFEANASLWSRHLEGASSLLAAYMESNGGTGSSSTLNETPTIRKLLDIYAYHEVLASVAWRRAPRIPASFYDAGPGRNRSLEEDTMSVLRTTIDHVVDGNNNTTTIGTGTCTAAGEWKAFAQQPEKNTVFLPAVDSLLSLVAQLATVHSARTEQGKRTNSIRSGSDAHTDQYISSAAAVVDKLRRWHCPDRGYSIETRCTAEAMRQAGILFYYWTMGGDNAKMDTFETVSAVHTIMASIGRVSVRHPVVASHIWPLYMAGLAATDEAQRAFIRQRLDDMIEVRGIKSITQLRVTLEHMWTSRTTAGATKRVMAAAEKQFGHEGLVLF
ncbi:Fungal Zn binuclear cluster domain containing protein [Niveomyces insectorum RCEF 264]|uniref:Fungal Zn binuclear cluster domain containing protein n=1 Tax=Niveomyces insectorum RCEF 264 TaxID=1081102 RepID=A0A167RTB8_9HYPO|nr:Fungal Zn binuclear cluster domain containing protein [Niveomyces insectorum RCEF 264]